MTTIDITEKQKTLSKFATNFLKMLSDEDCENIKLKFWIGLEDQINKLGLGEEIVIKIVFEEILNKNMKILSDKNLIFCITNFLRLKSPAIFDNYFLSLLFTHLQNYEETCYDFTYFLVELIFNFYFQINLEYSSEILNKIKKLLFCLIDFDINLVELNLDGKIEFEDNFLSQFFKVKEFNEILNYFIEKLLMKNKMECIFKLLDKIESYVLNSLKDNQESKDVLFNNITSTYVTLSSNFINNFDISKIKQKTIFIFEKILKAYKFILENKNNQNDLYNLIENFLLFILDNINNSRKINFSNLKIIFWFYQFSITNNNLFYNFQNIFFITLYSFSDEIYDTSTLKEYEKINNLIYSIKQKDIQSIILSEIILKSINLNQKTRYGINSNFIKNNLTFSLSNEYTITKNKSKDLIYFYNSSNLNLIIFLIKDNFIINEENKIQFNETNFINNLKVISSLNIENYDSQFQNFLFKFLFQIILTFYEDIYIKNKINPNYELFEFIFINLHKVSNKQFLKTEMYSIILNFMQTVLFPNYLHFSNNLKIFDLFFDFLFEFCRQDNIANLTSKLIISLYNLKIEVTDIKQSNKYYALDKYAELVNRTNSSKIFTQFFNFCNDLLKKESATNLILINDGIYKYSNKYEGALQSPLLDYVYNKFEKIFDSVTENLNFDTLFTLSTIYEILVKDQPEKILNRIYENFYNTKFLRSLDKFFKDFTGKDEIWINIIFNENSDLKHEHIHKNLEKLNISNLILNQKLDDDHLSISILLTFSKIFSIFISNIISHNKDHFDVKSLSDQNNKTISSLLQTFDYITNGILFSENKKTIPQLIFLNDFFSHSENLNFFYNTHSYYMAMNQLEKQNLDLSMLNEVNSMIIRDKNKQFLEYLKLNENCIFLMKNLINNIFILECNLISLLNSKKYSETNNTIKNFVVDSLYNNSSITSINKNENLISVQENKNLSAFFMKGFLEMIYSIKKGESNLKFNENIYLFILQHNLFIKYFKNIQDILNLDLILVNFYNVIKKYNHEEILKNFFNFLLVFSKINKSVFLFSLRLLMNKKIFRNVLLKNNFISNELYNLIIYLLVQIIFYSSYKNECINYISTIINNMETTIISDEDIINYPNLTNYGKLIVEIFSSLRIHSDESSHKQIEINKKFKDSLVQMLNGEVLVRYVNYLFVGTFNSEDNIKNLSQNYLLYLENFDILLNLKGANIITEKSICKQFLKDNLLADSILLFQDIAFPKSLYEFLINYSKLVKSKEKNKLHLVYLNILENYIIHHLIFKNNEKLLVDITRNLFYNKEFAIENELNLNWEEKYRLISMMSIQLLKDPNSRYTIFENKNETMKGLGYTINPNIFKK